MAMKAVVLSEIAPSSVAGAVPLALARMKRKKMKDLVVP
jgi:hypothetical protein